MKNKKVIITAAVAAGAALITYLIKRRRRSHHTELVSFAGPRTHHRTNVFSNAKNHADN